MLIIKSDTKWILHWVCSPTLFVPGIQGMLIQKCANLKALGVVEL